MGERRKVPQSDCVLRTYSVKREPQCFLKVSSGLKSHLFNGFCPAGRQRSIFNSKSERDGKAAPSEHPVRLRSGGDSGVSPSGLGKRAFAEFQRAPQMRSLKWDDFLERSPVDEMRTTTGKEQQRGKTR